MRVWGKELAKRIGMGTGDATDLADTLVALDLLERCEAEYANTVEAEHYLDPAKPSYAGWLVADVRPAA
jgi:hypothetical protein